MTQNLHDRDNEEIFALPEEVAETPAGQDHSEETGETTNRTPRRTKRAQSGGGQRTAKRRGARVNAEGIIELSDAEVVEQAAAQPEGTGDVAQETEEATICALEAQGFTPDEAIRLIHVSDRIANSGEVREAEAIIRRLRFNRWLFEQGKLNEFSA